MITMREIADVCDCSIATVSKALHNMPDISEKKGKFIRDKAKEMGYYPNAAARALKTRSSKTVALMVFYREGTIWSHNYYCSIASSIQVETEKRGYDLIPINCYGHKVMGNYLDYCKHRNYDGIILFSSDETKRELEELVGSDIPLVTIDFKHEKRDSVMTDSKQGVVEILNRAVQLGHRKIAFIHGNASHVTTERLQAFHETCSLHGIKTPPCYIQEIRYLDRRRAERATKNMLALAEPPTCILYSDDVSYAGGLKAIEQQKLHVPNDISAVGYDGTLVASLYHPKLTTYYQDATLTGRFAVEMLFERMDKNNKERPVRHVVVPGTFVQGETLAKPKERQSL